MLLIVYHHDLDANRFSKTDLIRRIFFHFHLVINRVKAIVESSNLNQELCPWESRKYY